MPQVVDFKNVSTEGLESSPVADALAGLRANEARYLRNKYKHEFATEPASGSRDTLEYVQRILKEERGIEFAARPLETSQFEFAERHNATDLACLRADLDLALQTLAELVGSDIEVVV